MNRQFPCLEISRSCLRHNMEEVAAPPRHPGVRRHHRGQRPAGRGRMFRDCATQAGPAAWRTIIRCRQAGVPGPYMLRILMESEREDAR